MPAPGIERVKKDCRCPRARHRHGTTSAYNADGCRCDPCTLARTKHAKRWRRARDLKDRSGIPAGLVPGAGTRRRLQALAILGWSTKRLGEQLGVTQARISELQLGDDTTRAQAALAARVTELYDRLWNTMPTWDGADRARASAARHGWLPPLAWDDDIDDPDARPNLGLPIVGPACLDCTHSTCLDIRPVLDEIAVERIARGRLTVPAGQTTPELLAAIAHLAGLGFADSEIGARVGRSTGAVNRLRERNGIPGGQPVPGQFKGKGAAA